MRFVGPEAWGYRAELAALADRARGRRAPRAARPGSAGPGRRRPRRRRPRPGSDRAGLPQLRMTLPNKLYEYVAAGLPVLGERGAGAGGRGARERDRSFGQPSRPGSRGRGDRANDDALSAVAISGLGGAPCSQHQVEPRAREVDGRLQRGTTLTPPRAEEPGSGSTSPRRRRLARTLSRPRWDEYRELLSKARRNGYSPISLESWIDGDHDETAPLLVLRHDVDQDPKSALKMLEIEAEAGIRSTWYFRWRTAHPRVIARVRAEGGDIGLHYETLTRTMLERGGRGLARGRPGAGGETSPEGRDRLIPEALRADQERLPSRRYACSRRAQRRAPRG